MRALPRGGLVELVLGYWRGIAEVGGRRLVEVDHRWATGRHEQWGFGGQGEVQEDRLERSRLGGTH